MTAICSRTSRLAIIAVGTITAAILSAAPASAAEDEAEIFVVQGLPNVTVDIEVDGKTVASDVETADVVGPFVVEAGTNKVVVTTSGGETLTTNTVKTTSRQSCDVVVHLQAPNDPTPIVTVFDNDMSAVPEDKASLTVAHTAGVPPVDIGVNGETLFSNIDSGESLNVVVPEGEYNVEVRPSGQPGPPMLGPIKLAVEGGQLNRVFAVGDPRAGTMNVAVHVIDVKDEGSAKPKMVNTGTGGQFGAMTQALSTFSGLWR